MRYLILAAVFLFAFANCTSNSTDARHQAREAVEQQVQQTQAPAHPVQMLPSLPLETAQMLYEKCDYVDYVFYELPISMSLYEKPSIQAAVRHISAAPAGLDPRCKPIGRIFFQIEGENVLQGDIYFTPGCTYFIFLDEQGKPQYGNQMTDECIQYLNNNFNHAGLKQAIVPLEQRSNAPASTQ